MADVTNFGPTYEISFDIAFNSDPTTNHNIIRITNTTTNNNGFGDKIVNINHRSDGRIAIVTNTGNSSSMISTTVYKGPGEWTNLKIVQEKADEDDYSLTIYVDGVEKESSVVNVPLQYKGVRVFASGNFLPAADAQIRNFYLSTEILH